MTNDELLELKQLALECSKLGFELILNREDFAIREKLADANSKLFEKAIMVVPDMVNEILDLRDEVERLDGNLNGL